MLIPADPQLARRLFARRLGLLITIALLIAACTTPRTPATPAPPTAAPPAASPTAADQPQTSPPAGAQGAGVAFATPPKPLTLPADAAPHRNNIEWWYYTGHLQTNSGRKFGFEFVIFQRMGNEPDKAGYVAHAAITDVEEKKFIYAQKLNIAALPTSKDEFSLKVDDWTMAGKDGSDRLNFGVEGYRLNLTLNATKPPVLHGGTGFITVGEKEFSYYYSRPRMTAEGDLSTGGETLRVSGTAWFDQQWGDFTLQGGGGWDWFGIQLEDGSDIMISNLRGSDGKRTALYGTLVAPDGKSVHLSAQDIQFQNHGLWISPKSGGRYPMGWSVRIPKLGIDLVVQPDMQDQELDTFDSTNVLYWEGKSSVQGFGILGTPVKGQAYVELTGYAKKAAP